MGPPPLPGLTDTESHVLGYLSNSFSPNNLNSICVPSHKRQLNFQTIKISGQRKIYPLNQGFTVQNVKMKSYFPL